MPSNVPRRWPHQAAKCLCYPESATLDDVGSMIRLPGRDQAVNGPMPTTLGRMATSRPKVRRTLGSPSIPKPTGRISLRLGICRSEVRILRSGHKLLSGGRFLLAIV